MFSSRSSHSSAPAALSAHDWAQRAQVAWREGAFDLAADCARQAVKLAPFSGEYRELFTDILYERIEAQRARGGPRESHREPARETYREPARPAHREPVRMPEPQGFDDDFDIPMEDPAPKRPPQRLVQSNPASQATRARSTAPRPTAAPPVDDYYEEEPEEEPSQLFGARRNATPPGQQYGRRRRSQAKVIRLVAGAALGIFLLAGAAAMGNWMLTKTGKDSASLENVPSALRDRIAKANKNLVDGAPDRAVADMRDAMKVYPANKDLVADMLSDALHADAERQLIRKNPGSAVKSLDEAIVLEPTNAELWTLLGNANKAVGLGTTDSTKKKAAFAASESAYRKALDLLEGHTPSMLGLGQVYAASNNRSKAVSQFEAIMKLAPQSPEAKIAGDALASLKKK